MNAWEIIFGWTSGNYPPSKDGRYYLARVNRYSGAIELITLDYTIEHGWNTSAINHEHAISYEGEDIFWTPALRMRVEEAVI